uniref:Major facilitator superfamily (MFS) profile domain-containing protein n=1 Tax=Candidozyma auris TaxID=498019 RepID=A0A0L0NUS6_CANAR
MPDNKLHLQPTLIKDASTGSAGVLASELAAEEDGLVTERALNSHSYGAVDSAKQLPSPSPELKYALPKPQLITVISCLYMAAFLAAMDTTVVTTLLTVIASELDAVQNIGWIATAYLLSCSAFQPLFGKLSDIFGRKSLLVLCCGFFAVGCCICVTNNLWLLVFGRFVTGIGGSGLTTLGTITMSDLIPLRDRGVYQGLANIFFGLGAASGGVIGGVVSDLFGWRWVFILQVPLAVTVGVAIMWNLTLPAGSPGLGATGDDFRKKLKRVDFVGSFFLVSSLMLILLAASLGGKTLAYSSKGFIGILVVALALLVAFVYTEKYISLEPILPIDVMLERTVLSSSLANWFYTMGVFAYLFYVPLYFQTVMDMSATQSGERLVPNFFAISTGSVCAGLYMRKTGKYYAITVLVGILALLGMTQILTLSRSSSLFKQFTIMLPSGFAYSCLITVTLLSLIASVPAKYQACTTSIQYTFRATGSTLGVSIASAVFQGVTRALLSSTIRDVIKDPKLANKVLQHALDNTNYVKEVAPEVAEVIRNAYERGCRGTYVFSTLTIAIGYATSLFMREHVLHTSIDRD